MAGWETRAVTSNHLQSSSSAGELSRPGGTNPPSSRFLPQGKIWEIRMKSILLVAAAAVAVFAASDLATARTRGGADIGPLGQCFNPPDCGGRNSTTGYS